MHFEVLVEDPSGKSALDIFMPSYWADVSAVVAAYPRVDATVLRRYRQDAICGTWELLADAVHRGGATAPKRAGWQAIGREKAAWAEQFPVRRGGTQRVAQFPILPQAGSHARSIDSW